MRCRTCRVAVEAAPTDWDLPGVDKAAFPGFKIGRKAAAAEKAVKKRCLDNHVRGGSSQERLAAKYCKTLTLESMWHWKASGIGERLANRDRVACVS